MTCTFGASTSTAKAGGLYTNLCSGLSIHRLRSSHLRASSVPPMDFLLPADSSTQGKSSHQL